ncbi:PocR ligand-binding domain-containing protein [Methanosarcina hadiensis]|uniref:PocR ligand-binding domain-containing protein n=1 Tax=Methanosarcina hadiensis TaxID=3078083 RepID=UPI00397773E2
MKGKLSKPDTGKKRVEEIPGQSNQCFMLKLETSVSDPGKTANLGLSDIINVQAIKPLMEDFYKLTHIPIGINDLNGNVLVSVGWQDICIRFHRAHPEACKHCIESDVELSSGVTPGEFKLYRCKNNMWDIVTPIMISGKHVGYVFGGQFFFEDEPVDYELFLSHARKYGFNEEEYIAALKKVPRLSREAVNTGMGFFMTFASMLSQLSYSNIKLAQSLEERDAVVNALRESEKRERIRSEELKAVLDAVPVAVFIAHDPQVLQITGNRLSCEWLRVPSGTNFSKSAPEGERPGMFELFKNGVKIPPEKMPSQMAAAGMEINDCELDILFADGEIRHVLGNARPLHDEQGNLRGSVSAFIDITERNRAEEVLKKEHNNLEKIVGERTVELEKAYNSLKESEKRLAEAQRMAHIGSYDWNIKTDEEYWSDEIYRIFGLDNEFELNHNIFLKYIHPEDLDRVSHAINEALRGKPYNIDYRIILPDGKERVVYSQGGVIFDEENTPIRMRGVIQDITEHKKAEENLTRIEVARKKEIHHRIKNNLQVISSLLDLQAEKFNNREYVKDSEIIEAFRESQDRVTSIALIHEELHEGRGDDALNFSQYLQRLLQNLFQAYRFGNTEICLKLDVEENIFFGMDTAVPLGMIINELVSNSLKYAFLDRETGEIRIKLFSEEEKNETGNKDVKDVLSERSPRYTLIVSDNGTGIPENIDLENSDTLGLQLVNILVDQLDGTVELKRDHGTEFIINLEIHDS